MGRSNSERASRQIDMEVLKQLEALWAKGSAEIFAGCSPKSDRALSDSAKECLSPFEEDKPAVIERSFSAPDALPKRGGMGNASIKASLHRHKKELAAVESKHAALLEVLPATLQSANPFHRTVDNCWFFRRYGR